MLPKDSGRMANTGTVDPEGAVWFRSTLFAKKGLNVKALKKSNHFISKVFDQIFRQCIQTMLYIKKQKKNKKKNVAAVSWKLCQTLMCVGLLVYVVISYVYIFKVVTLDEASILDAFHFSIKNIEKSSDLGHTLGWSYVNISQWHCFFTYFYVTSRIYRHEVKLGRSTSWLFQDRRHSKLYLIPNTWKTKCKALKPIFWGFESWKTLA